MSSILTNNGAMVALQTMKSITKSMDQVQQEISTGKSVANAKDNAAVWAISKTMESDVKGFKGISASLSLGYSTIAVARSAAEDITELLTEIKDKIVSSQEANVDRTKIQADVSALRDQITSIVGAAQFNGLNLLSNKKSGAAVAAVVAGTGLGAGVLNSHKVEVLSSLDRTSGGVNSSSITVARVDLGTEKSKVGAGTDIAASAFSGGAILAVGGNQTLVIAGDSTTTARDGHKILAGDTYTVTATGITGTMSYVARDGDTLADIAKGITERFNTEARRSGVAAAAEVAITTTAGVTSVGVKITNNSAIAITTATTATSGGTAGGGLELLRDIDVSTERGANAALAAIEGLTQSAIAGAARFGTAQKRIEVQQSFVSNLVDALRSGIGSMVDANMEEASARLQALQVQQQLATQSLSIANQAPQSILSLFR